MTMPRIPQGPDFPKGPDFSKRPDFTKGPDFREGPETDSARAAGATTRFRPKADDREATLLRLEAFAHLMDSAFVIPGINRRVGLDAVIGLVPIVGDVAGMLLASYIVVEARRLGAPRWLIARMAMNIAADGALGAVPLAGDLFDAAFKANWRNVRLLRRYLERHGGVRPNEIEGTATRIDG